MSSQDENHRIPEVQSSETLQLSAASHQSVRLHSFITTSYTSSHSILYNVCKRNANYLPSSTTAELFICKMRSLRGLRCDIIKYSNGFAKELQLFPHLQWVFFVCTEWKNKNVILNISGCVISLLDVEGPETVSTTCCLVCVCVRHHLPAYHSTMRHPPCSAGSHAATRWPSRMFTRLISSFLIKSPRSREGTEDSCGGSDLLTLYRSNWGSGQAGPESPPVMRLTRLIHHIREHTDLNTARCDCSPGRRQHSAGWVTSAVVSAPQLHPHDRLTQSSPVSLYTAIIAKVMAQASLVTYM